ncbi:MAG TPA: hypothetical protein VHW02_10880 [Rhizomicrobium sp.]|nr:hypothetical protein [Rhizomicrobium sp.]
MAAQGGMRQQAVTMENFALDRLVVVNGKSGVHGTAVSDFAGTLTTSKSGESALHEDR